MHFIKPQDILYPEARSTVVVTPAGIKPPQERLLIPGPTLTLLIWRNPKMRSWSTGCRRDLSFTGQTASRSLRLWDLLTAKVLCSWTALHFCPFGWGKGSPGSCVIESTRQGSFLRCAQWIRCLLITLGVADSQQITRLGQQDSLLPKILSRI